MRFSYPYQKFSSARSCLMLPPPGLETKMIATAFNEISIGLMDLKLDGSDDEIRRMLSRLGEIMNTDGLADPNGLGLHHVRAQQLTQEEKSDLAHLVDELATRFCLER